MLGNFFDDLNTDTLQMYGTWNCFSYYFLDNVCVSTDSLFTLTWTGIKNIDDKENCFVVYPNPTNDKIHIYSSEMNTLISIYNSIGEITFPQTFFSQNDIEI